MRGSSCHTAPNRVLRRHVAAILVLPLLAIGSLTASAQSVSLTFREEGGGQSPAAEQAAPHLAPAPAPAATPAIPVPPPGSANFPPLSLPADDPMLPVASGPSPVQTRCGVYCDRCNRFGGELRWAAERPIPWQVFAQGEYVGPARTEHVRQYRLRVDDQLQFVYRLTAKQSSRPYRFQVGDRLRVESLGVADLSQEAIVEPDGTITLPYLGQVPTAGRTIDELRAALNDQFRTHYVAPNILVLPLKINTRLEELRSTVDARYGTGGQVRSVQVTPEGTIQLPALGSVYVQGLSLPETKREVDERYAQLVEGMEVTPILVSRAPRYVFVVGEVRTPGRFTLEGPTTVMQAIALAGSWNVGANLKELVVFRRDDCWRLMATKIDIHAALFGHRPCPADEIWLRDSDIVLVPKSSLLFTDDMINLLFTRGLYSVFPMNVTLNFSKLSTL
ncbi:MAG: polysaccharide biosynthesis/export family protein [Thermoguttaceae bacterium]|jgi:polysaccharide export outer membrane protein